MGALIPGTCAPRGAAVTPLRFEGGPEAPVRGDAKPSLLRAHGDDPLVKGEQRALDIRRQNKKAILDSKRRHVNFNDVVME